MKYVLRFLLFLFVAAVLGYLWFFFVRDSKQSYAETPALSTKIHTGQTADFNENRNASNS